MAFVLTYTNLLTNLENYLQRTDPAFVAELPVFIMLAQRRIARDLKILGTRVVINGSLLPSNPKLQKPARWFTTSTFNIGSNVGTATGYNTRINLPLRTYEYCNIYWPDATATTQPKYLADYDFNTWYFAPTPDQAYPYECAFFQVPVLIDETDSTNFFTESCPDILIYASQLEAVLYLKDDDRVQVCQAYYNAARDALTKEDLERLYDNFSVNRGGA